VPLDPAEAAAEIRSRFTAASLDALLKALKPSRPTPTTGGGIHRLKIVREGKDDLVLAMNDREANTDNLRFLGERIAFVLKSWQYCADQKSRGEAIPVAE
jgi:hypothetical protein